jgi:glycosyltransferase involved in cell wall biosynthesis
MKIFFVAPSNSIHSHKWINCFVNMNHQVAWVSLNAAGAPKSAGIFFTVLEKPRYIFGWFYVCLRLAKIVRAFEPDVVHVHSAGLYGVLGLLTFFSPKIVTVWGSDVVINSESFLKRSICKMILKDANLITTDATHMIDGIRKIGVSGVPIEVIKFGIDTASFKPLPSKVGVLENFCFNSGPRVISMRNLDPIYDVETFVHAAKIVNSIKPDVNFYLGGDGPQKEFLMELISNLGISGNCHFLGYIDNKNLPGLLNAMDIYVSTSLSDAGIAASTAEAMACGLTCVVSNVYDNHEWIAHEENGFLFECGNAQNLADNIISILDSPESDLSVIRKGARKKILDDNDIYREMKKMEGLVQQLVEKTEV